jgi:hypothetical protein
MSPKVRGGAFVAFVLLTGALRAADAISYGPAQAPVAMTHAAAGRAALAAALGRLYTHHPAQLVDVIENAAGTIPGSPSVTLLLSVAYAETSGDVLDVSEAGAVGLAQATPIAYRQERQDGRLFVTKDYLTGARAYILKKPLHDADVIASLVLDDPSALPEARRLLSSARDLRRVGVDDLDLLQPFAGSRYFDSVRQLDARNVAVLNNLERYLDSGDRASLRILRDSSRSEYRQMLGTQSWAWRVYQHDLVLARDRMLKKRFGRNTKRIRRDSPYEAGEYLAAHLDARFSPRIMADFLVHHLERKANEANSLDATRSEELTAALYNGGAHNVRRMLSGLITYLPETEHYMRKVPAMRRRLDEAVNQVTPRSAGL